MRLLANSVKLLALLVFWVAFSFNAAATDYYAVSSGNWNAAATWATSCGAGGGAGFPIAGDNAYVCSGVTVNVNIASACTNLYMQGGVLNFSGNFTLSVSGNMGVTSGTNTITGNNVARVLNVSGTLSVSSGASLDIAGETVTITQTTTVDGTLSISNITGTKTFTGNVTINNGGTFSESVAEALSFGADVTINNGGTLTEFGAAVVSIAGNIQVDGTYTASTGAHTFSGGTKTISGTTNPISIPSVTVSGTYTNNGTLTVATALGGGGTLTNGASATLNIGTTAANLTITTLAATANGNTVNYNRGGAQTVFSTNYWHLTLSTSGAKTLQAGTTTISDLTLSGTATATTVADVAISGILNIGSGTTLTAAGFALSVTGTTAIDGRFTINSATGAKTLTGDVTVGAAGRIDITALGATLALTNNLTMTAGSTMNGGTNVGTVSVGGNLTVNSGGTSTLAYGAITVTGTTSIDGTLAISNVNGTKALGIVSVNNGGTVTISVAATITTNNLTINDGGIWNNSAGAAAITVSGDLTASGTSTFTNSAATTYAISGSISIANTVTFTSGTGVYTLSGASKTIGGTISALAISSITITGTVTNNIAALTVGTALIVTAPGTFTNNDNNTVTATTAITGTGTFIQGLNSVLYIGASAANCTISALTATANGNIVNYNRANTQTVLSTNYWHLTLSNTSAKTLQTGTTTISGDLTLSGTASTTTVVGLSIGGGIIIDNGTTFNVAGYDLTVTGGTTIGGGTSGSLVINNSAGTKIFTGLVTVAVGATWNNSGNSAVTFKGGISNYGTYTAGSGIHTFSTNSQALTGTFSIPSITVTGVTLTNNNSLTVSTALIGTGGLTQAASSTLYISFTGPPTISALTATANPNTVEYSGTTQTIYTTTYHHLNASGSLVKTLGAGISVNGDITVSGTATLADGGFQITGGGGTFTLGSGTAYTTTKTSDPCFPTSMTYAFNSASTVNINGAGSFTLLTQPATFGNLSFGGTLIKTLKAATAVTVNGTLTISASNEVADNGNTITAKGNVVNNGTHSGAGKIYLNSGSVAHAISGTPAVFGNLELDDATYGATFTSAGTASITGTLTVTAGTLTCNAFTTSLTVGGATNIGGTLTLANNTGIKTFQGSVTINTGGTWTSTTENTANELIFQNGISNSGTFNAGSATFDTRNQAISGTLSFANTVTITGFKVTNNGAVTITNTAAGTLTGVGGTWEQGGSSTLNYAGSTITSIVLDATTNTPNTVDYNRGGNQTTYGTSYYNLKLSTSGAKTLTSLTTINNDFTLSSTSTLTSALAAGLSVHGDLSIGSGVTFTANANDLTVDLTTAVDGTLTVSNVTGTKTLTGDVTMSGAVNFTAAETLTLSGNLTMTAGSSINNGGGTTGILPVAGGLTVNSGGTSTVGRCTFTVTGISAINGTLAINDINGTKALGTVSVNNGGTVDISAAATITTSNLTINSGGTWNNSAGVAAVTVSGDLTVSSTSVFTNSAATTYAISGNISVASDATTFTPGDGVYTLSGTSKTIGGTATSLSIPSVSVTAVASITNDIASLTVGTLLTVASPGTFTNNNSKEVITTTALSGTGSFIQGTNSILRIRGTSGITTLTATASGNTVYYNSNSAGQNVKATTYHHLAIDKSGYIATLLSGMTLNGNLTISAGTLADAGYTLTVKGDITNSATHSSTGAGELLLKGGSLDHHISGGGSFGNIELQDGLGAALGDGITVTGTLIFTAGNLDINGKVLTLSGSGTLSSESNSSRIVDNAVTKGYIQATATINNGTSTFGNIGATLTSTANLGSVTIKRGHAEQISTDPTYSGHKSILRYYDITPTNSGLETQLTLTYFDNELNGLTESNFKFYFSTNTGSTWREVNPSSYDNSANTAYINQFFLGGTRWTLGNGGSPLPIELLSFSGVYENKKVPLYWSTAAEINNDYFTIERSTDGEKFEIITDVKGAGNSNTILKYSAVDNNPPQGIVYYRLKQTDFDGKFKYSDVISVKVDVNVQGIEVSQPYFNGSNIKAVITNLSGTDLYVEIYNVLGAVYYSELFKPSQGYIDINVKVNNLSKGGVYFLRIFNGKEYVVKKFVY
ncbi:MAG: hypothetical protein PHD97_09370 [Bacteroidales bacterium]|nr:hypothetical protein [Bacteroidales bacterium]